MTHCSIVPPYLLQALSEASAGHATDCAGRTLEVDTDHRSRRLDPTPSAPTGGAPTGPVRRIHDARQTRTLPGELVRAEGDPATGDTAVTQAYDGLGDTWAFWDAAYGRNSLDGAGMALVATVHYGQDYMNAIWDGSQMVFGDGDGEVFLGFTGSLDLIGHELAHGITQFTSRLTYSGQPGALNESVSDVFGVLVKQYALGQTAEQADWLIGADLLAPGVQGRALRSMAAPGTAYDDPRLGSDPQPGHMDDYVETTDDNGGVHINSGIPNKAFHLVATALGGHAWERAGQIWWDTVSGQIAPDCDFATFADLTLTAARSRYGDGSPESAAVAEGWAGVGVTTTAPPPSMPPPSGPPPSGPDGGPDPQLVVVRRTGGFAGITKEVTVRLDRLTESEREAWRSLLDGERLTAWAAAGRTVPDAFRWTIICPGRDIEVTLDEWSLPTELRTVLERAVG